MPKTAVLFFCADARASAQSAGEDDYAAVKRAIEFISFYWRKQPSRAEIASAAGLNASELHALFRRRSGLTPKGFVQALTLDYSRGLLRQGVSVLDTAYAEGLSGSGRLHDLFVTHEGMSPCDFKSDGAGLTFAYGFHASPFGESIAVAAPQGLAALGWVDEKPAAGRADGDGKSA